MNIKKYFVILFLCLFVATFCQAQAKVEKAECDTTNYNLTMVLSYPQSKDVLYRSAKGCHAAYDYAFKHNLWKKMPWIKTKVREQGYWTKERVFEEGAKCSTKMEFKKMAPTAYSKAVKYKWIEEMNWFVSNVKPKGYWQNKQNTF
jgi:hypothetical protein